MRPTVGASQVRTDKQRIYVSMRILETNGKLEPSLLGDVSGPKVDGVDGNYRTTVSVRIGYDTCFIEATLQLLNCLLDFWFHREIALLGVVVAGSSKERLVYLQIDLIGVAEDPLLAVVLNSSQLKVQLYSHPLANGCFFYFQPRDRRIPELDRFAVDGDFKWLCEHIL